MAGLIVMDAVFVSSKKYAVWGPECMLLQQDLFMIIHGIVVNFNKLVFMSCGKSI